MGEVLRDWIFLGVSLSVMAVLLSIYPEKVGPVLTTSEDYLMEMVWILPAVMVLMGLFKVWVSKEMVVKYLGKASGLKGILVAVVLGATPTGPLYVAFPLAAAMLEKGARVMNIIVFLSAWACIKIPQEMVELQFLGLDFMVTRLILTVILVSVMGFFIEQVVEKTEIKGIEDEI
ncbi:hypothetical protein AKJ51_01250 [candidate division MSBL1 archaeon SCGC-AAA382A20]|uniref:Permease n=1 Tax=candidate division MSBL1 archaeon SCGC-AAA382A20 TaxID=1698280 RepID=A0A133VM23_9EURY|nr:hypothetical protein AKJ51_01250 [candidate division MSBL1 archaeon SCGC-AAA382A20]